jgi:nitroreductase
MYSSGYTAPTSSNMQLWEFYHYPADVLEKLTQVSFNQMQQNCQANGCVV